MPTLPTNLDAHGCAVVAAQVDVNKKEKRMGGRRQRHFSGNLGSERDEVVENQAGAGAVTMNAESAIGLLNEKFCTRPEPNEMLLNPL